MDQEQQKGSEYMESILRNSAALCNLLSSLFNYVWLVDLDSRMLTTLPGTNPEGNEVLHKLDDWLAKLHSNDRTQTQPQLDKLKSLPSRLELELRWEQLPNGKWRWMETVFLPLSDKINAGKPLFAIAMSDITSRKEWEDQLAYMAFLDPLTELPNRRAFEAALDQSLAYAKRYKYIMALLYMDFDDFKAINDSYGHETGDRLLQMFSRRVKGCVREIDTFARLGGDEFVVLLPQVDSEEGINKVASRILNVTRQGWQVNGVQLESTISMGISVFPKDGEDAAALLRHADAALYSVKDGGRNGLSFFKENN